jgi:hypothetical protein
LAKLLQKNDCEQLISITAKLFLHLAFVQCDRSQSDAFAALRKSLAAPLKKISAF